MPGCIPPGARIIDEIREQLVAVFRENCLGVKLHAGERVSPVTQPHHRPIIGPGRDLQLGL